MVVLTVPSIHCSSCEAYLKSILSPLSLHNLSIDLGQRSLSFSSDEITLVSRVEHLLGEAGYHVESTTPPAPHDWSSRFRRLFHSDARARRRHMKHCTVCQEGLQLSEKSTQAASSYEESKPGLQAIQIGSSAPPSLLRTTLSIEGMTCSACTSSISSQLLSHPSVASATINLVLNSAVVVHDPAGLPPKGLAEEIEDMGFGATVMKSEPVKQAKHETIFGVEGMTCSSCTNAIHSALAGVAGIESVKISLMQNSMTIVHDPSTISSSTIISLTADVGFDAVEWETKELRDEVPLEETIQRSIQIEIAGMFCQECPRRLNEHFSKLPLVSFTPLTLESPRMTIVYIPSPELTIRTLLSLPTPFSGSLYQPPTLFSRSRALQAREARRLLRLFLVSTLFAIPTFVFGVMGMMLLPSGNAFRQYCDAPVWGGATRAVVAIFVLATCVQFGIGWIFYVKSFGHIFSRRSNSSSQGRRWKWTRLIHFGNMDLLVALSTTTAYFASLAMMIIDIRTPPDSHHKRETMSYFDSCVFLVFFILMGRVLEGRVRVKTGDAIAMLGTMRPDTALLVVDNSDEQQDSESDTVRKGGLETVSIPVDHLEISDRILLRPGSIPPADGTLLSGNTTMDESSLTGESVPVPKQPGDSLLTGTTNLTGAVVMRVDKLGDATVLQKIVQAVAEAQSKKAPIERLADRITSVFVPAIVWLSLLILVVWLSVSLTGAIPDSYLEMGRTAVSDRVFFAFEFAIACLVVACPCGIGLAAPTAQAVGAGMAARAGILAQGGGEAFQLASVVDTVVFDKTGTLTMGEAVVVDAEQLVDAGNWLWAAVRALEEGSSHPLGVALVKYSAEKIQGREDEVELVSSEEVAGKGVKGLIRHGENEYEVLVGNEGFVKSQQARYPEGTSDATLTEWKAAGRSVVLVALADASAASGSAQPAFNIAIRIGIADTPRPEASTVIATLRKAGKEVWMLSGDNETTARAVARGLGIEDEKVVAGVLPHEKAGFIKTLRERTVKQRNFFTRREKVTNCVVAFCGDGLNDTAALAGADVGVALSHGSQITLTTASFVLLSTTSALSALPTLFGLSRRVYRRQKLNFGWAMVCQVHLTSLVTTPNLPRSQVYNLAMLPLAAGVFYPAGHTRLPPVWSALAMALSSVSVVLSSLALKWGI
ncbi:hypothetical protein BOTBODRAFT_395063 [Botryobasidium botryosum FD-172 SS1]|uniref:HMA domain-containing protein n=1 Tax=Botryobasidium botryosum (strain FD-172 SS1) TaxID=930990 RepID=A0A067N8E3_BOTB1|nr:hypothetical protein BOTBODRAFT_395063 [Botryobasidium botryosum FD-172 SS1]